MKITTTFINQFCINYSASQKVVFALDDDEALDYWLTKSPLAPVLDRAKMDGDIVVDLFMQAMNDYYDDENGIRMSFHPTDRQAALYIDAFKRNMGKYLKDRATKIDNFLRDAA